MRGSFQKINDSTIVSISTPLSQEGAIGILRLSGSESLRLAESVFKAKSNKALGDYPVRTMVYGNIVHGGRILDEVLCVYFKAPYSYTTEDLVEFHCHGNHVQLVNIQDIIIELGAVPAARGEFTKRAFLGGRIDLSQAEAVMDMVSAKTALGFELALKQLGGKFGKAMQAYAEKLTDLMARIEVCIDYPDEDIELIETSEIRTELIEFIASVDDMLAKSKRGKIVQSGLNVAIVGVPNVGKSSLMNFLLQEERAIVTDIPGTTRDILREWVEIGGIPVHLIDTAGIRQTDDVIEKIGVEKSKASFNDADILIVVIAKNKKLSEEDVELLKLTADRKAIVLLNKSDLEAELSAEDIERYAGGAAVCEVSIKEGRGLEDFISEFKLLAYGGDFSGDGEISINGRQYSALTRARNYVEAALNSLDADMPIDLIEIDLISSLDAIGEITGHSAGEEVIDRIFEKFCLGK